MMQKKQTFLISLRQSRKATNKGKEISPSQQENAERTEEKNTLATGRSSKGTKHKMAGNHSEKFLYPSEQFLTPNHVESMKECFPRSSLHEGERHTTSV